MFKKIENLFLDIQDYLKTRGQLLRINAVEKSSQLLMWLMLTIVALLIGLFALAFITVALTLLLAKVIPLWSACLINAALFLLLLVVIFYNRERMFLNPILRRMSDIFYADEEPDEQPSAPKEEVKS